MITMKIIFHDDVTGKPKVSNVPIDLIEDVEELPLFELKEMNVFGEYEVFYFPAPKVDVDKPLYN